MRIALAPMQVDAVNMEANARVMAKWVEALHERVDLILFPRTVVSPLLENSPEAGRGFISHKHADLLCSFAARRRVFIAGELLEQSADLSVRMLMMADRMGQLDAQSRRVDAEGSAGTASLFITARIAGERIALASADDLEKQRLPIEANLTRIKAVVVPLHFTGSPAEIRRVAVHNPPAALEDLKERLSQVARRARVHVLVANALGEDTDTACGPCGGLFVFDPSGEEIQSGQILDRKHLEFELP